MTYKQTLSKKIEYITSLIEPFNFIDLNDSLDELKKDLLNETYRVAVVGEFNSGKTTFINALLKESLLPTGITPTTATINVCSYSKEKKVTVYYKDSSTEVLPYHHLSLEKFIVKNNNDVSNIDYIEIESPIELLKNKVVLIDTPGLNDVEDTREDITYEILPKADVVFFMLNIINSFRKTEFDFIKGKMLKEGMDRVIFIANFIDELDDDEIEMKLETIKYTIENELNIKNPTVLTLSAYEAIEGILLEDEELISYSGISDVESIMEEMFTSNSRAKDKSNRLYSRLYFILKKYVEQLSYQLELANKSTDELEKSIQAIEDWKQNQKDFRLQIDEYIDLYKDDFHDMIRKSIDYEFNQIKTETQNLITSYNGSDYVEYIENHAPTLVRRRLEKWIELYSPKMSLLLQKLEDGLASGLSDTFNEEILLRTRYNQLEVKDKEMSIILERVRDTAISSGLLVGGASALLMTLGTPVLVPVIAMAGLPYVRENMHKKQMAEVKPRITNKILSLLDQHKRNFIEEILEYFDKNIKLIEEETIKYFEKLIQKVEQDIEEKISEMKDKSNKKRNESDSIKESISIIKQKQLKILEAMDRV